MINDHVKWIYEACYINTGHANDFTHAHINEALFCRTVASSAGGHRSRSEPVG